VTKTKVELNQNFRGFLLIYKDKATIKIAKNSPGVAKSWHPILQGWLVPPHATQWLRACHEEVYVVVYRKTIITLKHVYLITVNILHVDLQL